MSAIEDSISVTGREVTARIELNIAVLVHLTRHHRAAEQKRLKQKIAAATARANRIITRGGMVPAPLKRFTGTRVMANRPRRAGRKGG